MVCWRSLVAYSDANSVARCHQDSACLKVSMAALRGVETPTAGLPTVWNWAWKTKVSRACCNPSMAAGKVAATAVLRAAWKLWVANWVCFHATARAAKKAWTWVERKAATWSARRFGKGSERGSAIGFVNYCAPSRAVEQSGLLRHDCLRRVRRHPATASQTPALPAPVRLGTQ